MIKLAVMDMATAKKVAVWGTFGKGGFEHCRGRCSEHEYKEVRLIDCSTEHLQAILDGGYVDGVATFARAMSEYRDIIESILEDRKL
jgi:hypothetical protein